MQSLALAWLILDLTHSAFYLGLEGFANTIPIAIFSFYGGVIADRFDRRRLLILTQWVMLILATILPRYQFRLLPGVEMVPEPLITLRPRGKLLMTISQKGGQSLPQERKTIQ